MFAHQNPQETRDGMVVERGFISRREGQRVWVSVQPADQCQSCDSRLDCLGIDDGAKTVEAINGVGADVGDLVEFGVPSPTLLKVSFLLFFLPMIMALAGGFLGRFAAQSLEQPVTPVVIAGVVIFLAIALVPVRLVDRRAGSGDHLTPRVTRVIHRAVMGKAPIVSCGKDRQKPSLD